MRSTLLYFVIISCLAIFKPLSVQGVIRACHLNNEETNACYFENVGGMVKILQHLREKPDPMIIDDMAFDEIVGDEGVATVLLRQIELYNVLDAEVLELKTIYDREEGTFAIDMLLKMSNVKQVCSADIEVVCDDDGNCQGFREFDSQGELTFYFDELSIHTLLESTIEFVENRKVLQPFKSTSKIQLEEKIPNFEYRSYSNSVFSNVMVRRLLSDNWTKMVDVMKENINFLRPYDEFMLNRTTKYFTKLAVFE